jgi:hypothetical protein
MLTLLAHGTLSWNSAERRSDRYGEIYLDADAYSEPKVSIPTYDTKVGNALVGKRVRLIAKVTKARPSGHVGDLFLGIKPSQPEVGEEIDLGVGIFEQGSVDWSPMTTIMLKPGDGRETFWFDPRKLYRLHDQTIDMFIEETTDDFSPAPKLGNHAEPDMVLSAGDGYIQAKKVEIPTKLYPEVKPLGGGLFVVTPPGHGPVGSPVKKN